MTKKYCLMSEKELMRRKEYMREYNKEYYKKNRNILKVKSKLWKQDNPERNRMINKMYRLNQNPYMKYSLAKLRTFMKKETNRYELLKIQYAITNKLQGEKNRYELRQRPEKDKIRTDILKLYNSNTNLKNNYLVTMETEELLFVRKLEMNKEKILIFENDTQSLRIQNMYNYGKKYNFIFGDVDKELFKELNKEKQFNFYLDYCDTLTTHKKFINKLFMNKLLVSKGIIGFTFAIDRKKKESSLEEFSQMKRAKEWILKCAENNNYNLRCLYERQYKDGWVMFTLIFEND